MSRQIALRLADDLVEFIDQEVRDGHAGSRAEVVAHALEQERRRELALRDAAIYARQGEDPDLVALAEYAAQTSRDDLD